MKILFITYTSLDLYKPVEEEMRRQGHNVTTVLYNANDIKYDPYKMDGSFKKIKKFFFVDLYNIHDAYWKRRIANTKELSDRYDILFVLSGTSVGRYLINHIEKHNPGIKKILYTWDNLKYYDFRRLVPYFDKSYTFDLEDSKSNRQLSFLPIYFVEDKDMQSVTDYKYDVFHIGSNHSGRYSFINKLMPQIQDNGLSYYIKVIGSKSVNNKMSKIHHIAHKLINKNVPDDDKDARDFNSPEDPFHIKAYQTISMAEYNDLCRQSKVIIDTQRSNQSGLTARFMWAIGNGKKVITTNRFAYDYSFVSESRVQIVDFENPVLPVDFIKGGCTTENDCSDIIKFRIDNWVKTILGD